jgi:hypothetical protein
MNREVEAFMLNLIAGTILGVITGGSAYICLKILGWL